MVGSDSKISIGGVGQDTGGLDHVAFKTAEGQGLEPKSRAGGGGPVEKWSALVDREKLSFAIGDSGRQCM